MLDSITSMAASAMDNAIGAVLDLSKKQEKIIDILLVNGFKEKDIIAFLYVNKTDVKAYVKTRKQAIKIAKKMSQPHVVVEPITA